MSTSNVTLSIAGRVYTIACAPGEEAHIERLGAFISTKLVKLDRMKGQSTERVLLYASLLLADELHEAQAAVQQAPAPEMQAEALEKMADRLEGLANVLESGDTNA
ncbi:MAG: cell division protein ZapA [Alteraurantiacibacter sp.]